MSDPELPSPEQEAEKELKHQSSSVEQKDEDSKSHQAWQWCIVMDAVGSDADKDKSVKPAYTSLLKVLLKKFGKKNVKVRTKGALDKQRCFIKVTLGLEKLEKVAKQLKIQMPLLASEGGGYLPFDPSLKEIFKHPYCTCVDEDKCECCTETRIDPVTEDELCGCNLFLPFQVQVLVEEELKSAIGMWCRKLQAKVKDNENEEKGEVLVIDSLAVKWALDHPKLSHLVDVFPLHLGFKKREFNPKFPSRIEFIKQYSKISYAEKDASLLQTPFSFTDKSKGYIKYIRSYFGEKAALYFAFLHYYNSALLIPGIIGFIVSLINWITGSKAYEYSSVPFFCIFICIWAFFFLVMWQRKQSAYGMHFNMRDYETKEKELDTFTSKDLEKSYGFYEPLGDWVDMENYAQSKIEQEPEIEPFVPKSLKFAPGQCPDAFFPSVIFSDPVEANTNTWRFFQQLFSFSVILIMIAIVVLCTISLMVLRLILQSWNPMFGSISGGAFQAIIIVILDYIYYIIAIKLNDFEQHRTATIYEDHLIIKLFIFQFINSYFSLFYIAFVKNAGVDINYNAFYGTDVQERCYDLTGNITDYCMDELTAQLISLFITRMIFGNLVESVYPWAKGRFIAWWQSLFEKSDLKKEHPDWTDKDISLYLKKLGKLKDRQDQGEKEFKLDKYSGTADEYSELVIQFGYVILFAPAFPFAAFIALFSNIIENSSDAFKMFFSIQRFKYQGATDIGSWFGIFYTLAFVAVFTNTLIIGFTSPTLEYFIDNPSLFTKLFVVIIVEHLIFALQFLLFKIFPDDPAWVRSEVAKISSIRELETEYNEFKTKSIELKMYDDEDMDDYNDYIDDYDDEDYDDELEEEALKDEESGVELHENKESSLV